MVIKRMGRPSKLTPILITDIYDDVIQGATPNNACRKHGVSPQLKDQWLTKGEDNPDSLEGDFYEAMEQATGHALTRAEQLVYAGVGGWQASARWLETASKDWVRKQEVREDLTQKVKVEGNGYRELPPQQWAETLVILAKAGVTAINHN